MKVLIIYESHFGNTRTIAQAIAKSFADVEVVYVKDATIERIQNADLLIVGSPVHAWHIGREMKPFLDGLAEGVLSGKKVTAFDTRFGNVFSGSAAGKIGKKLVQLGGTLIQKPESFIVTGLEGPLKVGEESRAEAWGASVRTLAEK